ncbi:hypothetical protein G210_2428 [Candida maltosa Xu316]|uniref:Autophagy-related protein 28 n=1 Tax=Candida maltosa (strain Xu316) TaxID=1245528 RepID=M3ILK2_CANMX|nr:hypothetical protein G210_2428 [Candida maltosa Xu316]
MASSSINNGFDSINLASTIHSDLRENPISKRLPSTIPMSTSEDDEDDELDPEEFISSKEDHKPVNKRFGNAKSAALLHSTMENSRISSIDDSSSDIFYAQDSILIKSIKFPTEMYQENSNYGSESPIEYLSNKIKLLTQELYEDASKYDDYLQSGNGFIYNLRNKIIQNYNNLSESYYSLSELYAKDITYAEKLHDSFEKWDRQRNKVIAKMKSIKSDSNKHGAKLYSLLDESNEVDKEISELEERLEKLRSKKTVLNKEIEDTSSVLESRTAKYVDIFKNLEKQGKSSILSFLQSNGVPDKDIESIVRYLPVDVTILNNYSIKKSSSSQVDLAKEIETNAPPPQNPTSIGMQPFIIPEETNAPPAEELLSLNHDHGPTPFEKGYAKGSQNSAQFKMKMNNLVGKFIESMNKNNDYSTARPSTPSQVKVDDLSNTINEKLDLEPITTFLEHKVAALNDLVGQVSKNATFYHEFGEVWENVTKLMNLQEEKLENQFLTLHSINYSEFYPI